jgi:NAD-dependent DNA ligase
MEKLDGVSCLLTINKKGVFLTTRGDGQTGKDISFLKYYINIFAGAPPTQQEIYVRGEIVIQKDERLQNKER